MSSEVMLEKAAKDGTFDPNDWPPVLETVLARLDHIFHHEFPRPFTVTLEAQHVLPAIHTPVKQNQTSSQDSQTADKENAPPSTPPSRPPVPPFSRPTQDLTPTSSPTLAGDATSHTYPPELISLHNNIRTSLKQNFPKFPPHTIQRLAELIVSPKAHYRFLPPYLRALDRVVSVSSPTTIFPLPQATLPSNHNLVNGGASMAASSSASFGSDESLGGALLTPIPWLRPERPQDEGSARMSSSNSSQNELISESTEMVDGPNGTGRIETVTVSNGVLTTTTSHSGTLTVPSNAPRSITQMSTESLRDTGAITQGELLRQEQEAGVVPVSQTHTGASHSQPHAHPQPRSILPSNAMSQQDLDETTSDMSAVPSVETDVVVAGATHDSEMATDEQRDERPHARGPEQIGMEDMGPQRDRSGSHLDIAAAVGRTLTSPGRSSVSPDVKRDVAENKDEEMADAELGHGEGGQDAEEGTVLTDVDGNTDEKLDKMDAQGEGKGAEGVDTSAQ
ncbi:hypothetical protein EJ05DRAFT_360226 [Pseudovirgaria hyperparasitica]|uniref:Protein phosphatase 4 core regulatory subunit R2 n=1 Tax=Pseudovirgaria hyperparasitica TaxID=470096 RepID=A0A6A6W8W2_9PEZI|nr:uncharacterized protein EJ05DRAFT_360226 [Pseudovirgaria hyperparasitica]KAF2758639.1 hypothetical protein EJ05DRAFT_360226 [Pseudovirgaria hyperparasitica]